MAVCANSGVPDFVSEASFASFTYLLIQEPEASRPRPLVYRKASWTAYVDLGVSRLPDEALPHKFVTSVRFTCAVLGLCRTASSRTLELVWLVFSGSLGSSAKRFCLHHADALVYESRQLCKCS